MLFAEPRRSPTSTGKTMGGVEAMRRTRPSVLPRICEEVRSLERSMWVLNTADGKKELSLIQLIFQNAHKSDVQTMRASRRI